MTQGEVARRFGISKRTVRRIGREPPVVEGLGLPRFSGQVSTAVDSV